MTISSRTPEGQSGNCPVCRACVVIEPSIMTGDAPCPQCGHLLWFVQLPGQTYVFQRNRNEARRERLLNLMAEQLGVSIEQLTTSPDIYEEAGADSLDITELIMSLDEEMETELAQYMDERARDV